MATSRGGLLSSHRDGATGPAAVELQPLRPRGPSAVGRALPPLVLLALLAAIVAVLARFTMYVPSPPIEQGRTSYELLVRSRSGAVPDPELVETLWRTCRVHVPGRSASIAPLGENRFRLTVTPAIGRQDDLRFSGCLADLRFDFVITDILTRDGVVAAAPAVSRGRPS
jgi:hypothetical protein